MPLPSSPSSAAGLSLVVALALVVALVLVPVLALGLLLVVLLELVPPPPRSFGACIRTTAAAHLALPSKDCEAGLMLRHEGGRSGQQEAAAAAGGRLVG